MDRLQFARGLSRCFGVQMSWSSFDALFERVSKQKSFCSFSAFCKVFEVQPIDSLLALDLSPIFLDYGLALPDAFQFLDRNSDGRCSASEWAEAFHRYV